MYNIVLKDCTDEIKIKIIYLFINIDINIISYEELVKNKIIKDDYYIFIYKILSPLKNFIEIIDDIINKNILFTYLSKSEDIFIVNKLNIKIENNEIIINIINDSKKYNIFYDNINIINSYDHIIIPEYINNEYIYILKNLNIYNKIISQNISYKTYNNFIINIVKDKFCYNFILFINNIDDFIKLVDNINSNYTFFRITIFHNIYDEHDKKILKYYSKKLNISDIFINNIWYMFFNINNNRLLWFEKNILFNNKDDIIINDNLFVLLNNIHSSKISLIYNIENIILENLISISASDFVSIPYFSKDMVEL